MAFDVLVLLPYGLVRFQRLTIRMVSSASGAFIAAVGLITGVPWLNKSLLESLTAEQVDWTAIVAAYVIMAAAVAVPILLYIVIHIVLMMPGPRAERRTGS